MMTKTRALARARLLLGPRAHVDSRLVLQEGGPRKGEKVMRYSVGEISPVGGIAFNMVRGSGESWEAALDEADCYVNAIGVQLHAEDIAILLEAPGISLGAMERLRCALRALQAREERRSAKA